MTSPLCSSIFGEIGTIPKGIGRRDASYSNGGSAWRMLSSEERAR